MRRPILEYLRRMGAAPLFAAEPPPASPAEALLARFGGHLTGERGLTLPVAQAYCHWVRPFVENVPCHGDIDHCRELSGVELTRFLAARLPALSRKSAQFTGCALRSLLRFLHCEGIVEVCLADTVPAVACWKGSGLARPLDAAHALCHGKGRKDRGTPLDRETVAVLRVFIAERATPDGYLFPTRTGTRMSRDAVAARLTQHTATAAATCPSLAGKKITPHILRHTCAMRLLEAGSDASLVALFLGHGLELELPGRK